jgi:hypothetical protein
MRFWIFSERRPDCRNYLTHGLELSLGATQGISKEQMTLLG